MSKLLTVIFISIISSVGVTDGAVRNQWKIITLHTTVLVTKLLLDPRVSTCVKELNQQPYQVVKIRAFENQFSSWDDERHKKYVTITTGKKSSTTGFLDRTKILVIQSEGTSGVWSGEVGKVTCHVSFDDDDIYPDGYWSR